MRGAPLTMGDHRGITLAEVLAATGVVATGLVAVASAVPVALHAVADAGQTSAAFFLATAKLEDIRRAPWRSAPPEDGLGISPAPSLPPQSGGATTFADEPATPGALGGFTRQVRISDCGSGAGCGGVVSADLRQVTVRVSYRLPGPGSAPSAQREVMLTTLVTRR